VALEFAARQLSGTVPSISACHGILIQGFRRITMLAKQAVRELLDRMPDDCTLDDVLYHLYVVRAVESGQADVAAGRTLPHQQVAEELRKKWQLGDAG
jgi:predicted transcriptional regulator